MVARITSATNFEGQALCAALDETFLTKVKGVVDEGVVGADPCFHIK